MTIRSTAAWLPLLLLPGLLLEAAQASASPPAAPPRQADPTETPTSTPTATETAVPPTVTPATGRPIVVVEAYSVAGSGPGPGQAFTLQFRLLNAGQGVARDIIASFTPGDFLPGGNGGVVSGGTLAAGASTWYSQELIASSSLVRGAIGLASMTVSYSDDATASYSESFNLGIGIGGGTTPSGSSAPRGTPTPTATPVPRPLLIVVGYDSDPPILKPGSEFVLTLHVRNFGGDTAERISMILGGGTGSTGGQSGGEGNGGVNASGGDFTVIAPLGSANLQFLGDLQAAATLKPTQRLIVSGATKPGVYVIRLTFSYTDGKGKDFSDEQVISLLVQSAPLLDVSFYRPPDPQYVGQPSVLPIQVVNLNRANVQLGRLRVTYNEAGLENGESMIGYLDPGGYFTIDPLWIPEMSGEQAVLVSVGYVDDFNQSQLLTWELPLEVLEMPEFPGDFPDPGDVGPGDGMPGADRGFWSLLWRAFKGLIGLDSGPGGGQETNPMPVEEFPIPMG